MFLNYVLISSISLLVISDQPVHSRADGPPELLQSAEQNLPDERRDIQRENFAKLLKRIDAGIHKFENHQGYIGEVVMKERVKTKILPVQKIEIKIIDEPFRVKLKWIGKTNKGREVFFANDENDNKLKILNPTPLIKGPISLHLESPQVLSQFRYPITQIGIVSMAKRLQKDLRSVLARTEVSGTCEIIPDKTLFKSSPFERKATQFVLNHKDRDAHPIYRKRIVFVDDEFNLPIQLNGFTWPEEKDTELNESAIAGKTFIEGYQYRKIKFSELSDSDFMLEN